MERVIAETVAQKAVKSEEVRARLLAARVWAHRFD